MSKLLDCRGNVTGTADRTEAIRTCVPDTRQALEGGLGAILGAGGSPPSTAVEVELLLQNACPCSSPALTPKPPWEYLTFSPFRKSYLQTEPAGCSQM